jgi:hypothetical protein
MIQLPKLRRPRLGTRSNVSPARATDRALAAADALVAGGELTHAIDVLTEANRSARDRRLERRLVELRSEAFLQASRTEDRPAWPDVAEDLFPGTLVPEVRGADLTVEHIRSGILNHGSLLVRGLVGDEHVARLRVDIDRALAAYDASVAEGEGTGIGGSPDVRGWYERFPRDRMSNRASKRLRGSILTVESPPTLFDLIEAFRAAGVDRLVHAYFGEQPMLLARKGTLRRIAAGGTTGAWHQDGAFMGAGTRSLNIWLSLSHCGRDAPGIDVVGRRLPGIVATGDGAFAAWATSPAAAAEVAEGVTVRPVFAPGDALIFDQLNLHRTAIEPEMTRDRYAIETWLFAPSTYQQMTTAAEEGYTPRDQVPVLF